MTAPPRTPWRQRLLLIVFGVALGALALVVLELALALFGAGEEGRFADPFVGFAPGGDVFVRHTEADGSEVYITDPSRLGFFNEQRFAATKPAGGYRVFALGGSTVAGRPYDAHLAFPAWLERYLEDLDPDRSWEVVNAGAISYASYRLVLLAKELARHQPDLFVIYTGHNEFLEERTYGDLRRRDPRLLELGRKLGGFRFWVLARRGLAALRPAPSPEPSERRSTLGAEVATVLEGWEGLDRYRRDEALRADIIEHFAYNLRQLVAIGRDAGAEVVLVQPIANLKDFSPFKSEHGAEVDAPTRARIDDLIERGQAAEAVALDPLYAESHFHLGRALLARGDEAAARDGFIAAKDLDVAPLRAIEPILAAIRAVAAETATPLIDLPRLLEADSRARLGVGILGNEYLLDHVHPDTPVHSLIAERLADLLVTRGTARPRAPAESPQTRAAGRKAIYDRVVAGLDRRYYAQRDLNLAKVLGWAGKLAEAEAPLRRAAEVLDGDPDLHFNLGVLYQKTGRPDAAAVELRRAVALRPELAEAHFNLGVTLGMLGRDQEGIAAFERALALRPDYPEARYDLGVLQRRAGELEAAADSFEQVLALRPGSARALHGLGLVRRRQGRHDEAIGLFERAIEAGRDGSSAVTEAVVRADLGGALARAGRLDEAVAAFEAAVALDPDFAQAHYDLGVAEAARGRPNAARAAYEQALEADPEHVDALLNLGVMRAAAGERAAAERHFVHVLELAPERAAVHLNLAVLYENAGRLDAAAAAGERAVALEPDNPRFHYVLGLIEFRRGRLDAAREHLAVAAAAGLEPPSEVAARLR